ncbi:MAG: HAD-IA family hydrolase [Alphaproteobacteria bacterium]|nr:HAD-IA family hydrolase [Alphaproteobacteria bacterium]
MRQDLKGAAIIFDLDGTLIDTADDLAASMNHALGQAGLPAVAHGEVRHLVGHGARAMLMRGIEAGAGRAASEAELEQGLKNFLDHYGANIAAHSRPFDGVIEMIGGFRRRGAGIAICTNKREALSRLLIDTLAIGALFDTIVGADTCAAAKPDPAPVLLCIEQTSATRSVFIGDSDTDIKAAGAAGLPCLIAEFGYGPLTLRDQAAGAFTAYSEAAAMIENLLAR